ncbi:Retrovirus-related Pol polyprotein from transposon TNT 1-94 [Araneus ventricosus]|uniref:Retrovirus-related Pol polyprotein from transposon TNT 1-94 n=1 Tax=Araneus ventricosus TaxID=182803 RepID=A0A4Y2JW76_ARAVE|nr:Retrovirus-related Pol polyprotein from transposon TNT 1-94 [Araneus ventricosus]
MNISHKNNLKIWHQRTGHKNLKALCELSKRGLIEKLDVSNNEDFFCEGCQFDKQQRFSTNPREYKATKPGELIYGDICGPMSVQSLSKTLFNCVRTNLATKSKHLRVDNGTEYISLHFNDFLNKKGIQLETTAPYTPQQNGRSERDMRTIVESARSMMYSKELPLYVWSQAVNTAIYILNRTPTSQAPDSTPHELWTGKSTSLNHLRIFGSEAYMHVPENLRKKLEPNSKKVIFVGYEKESKNYRLFDPVAKTIKVLRNVVFNGENSNLRISQPPSTFLFTIDEEDSNSNHSVDEVQDNLLNNLNSDNAGNYGLRPRNNLRVPVRYELNVADIVTPQTYEEALNYPQADNWKEDTKEEVNSLEKNETWDLVPVPETSNVIGSNPDSNYSLQQSSIKVDTTRVQA